MENTAHTTKESIEYYKAHTEKLEMEKEALESELKWYEEQFRLSQQRRFGSSSEKTDSDQLSLFNEAEDTANPTVEEPTVETITYKRKKQHGQQHSLKNVTFQINLNKAYTKSPLENRWGLFDAYKTAAVLIELPRFIHTLFFFKPVAYTPDCFNKFWV